MPTNETKKKLLLVITKGNFGGAQRYVYDLATHLPHDQYDVTVAVGTDGELISMLEAAGITVVRIPGLQRNISLRKELLSAWHMAHLIRTYDPDILHVNSSKAGFIGACVGRILGVPRVIYTAHGWAFNEDRGVLSRFIVGLFHWLTIIFAHQTIAVSHTLKAQMRWPGAQNKMIVIHNGRAATNHADKDAARQALAKIHPPLHTYQTDTWTGTIAELHPTKQHSVPIAAIKQLVKQGIPVRHIIMGEGEERAALEQQIADANLSEHVFLIGALPDAARYLKALDIFILPSRSEALAYVAIEAAQAGLPIVASNVGGIPEVITDRHEGTLVPAGDVTHYADAITRYIKQPTYAASHAMNAKTKSAQFSISQMVKSTISIYQGDNTV